MSHVETMTMFTNSLFAMQIQVCYTMVEQRNPESFVWGYVSKCIFIINPLNAIFVIKR